MAASFAQVNRGYSHPSDRFDHLRSHEALQIDGDTLTDPPEDLDVPSSPITKQLREEQEARTNQSARSASYTSGHAQKRIVRPQSNGFDAPQNWMAPYHPPPKHATKLPKPTGPPSMFTPRTLMTARTTSAPPSPDTNVARSQSISRPQLQPGQGSTPAIRDTADTCHDR